MGQPVEQRAGEALGAEGFGPFIEGQANSFVAAGMLPVDRDPLYFNSDDLTKPVSRAYPGIETPGEA